MPLNFSKVAVRNEPVPPKGSPTSVPTPPWALPPDTPEAVGWRHLCTTKVVGEPGWLPLGITDELTNLALDHMELVKAATGTEPGSQETLALCKFIGTTIALFSDRDWISAQEVAAEETGDFQRNAEAAAQLRTDAARLIRQAERLEAGRAKLHAFLVQNGGWHNARLQQNPVNDRDLPEIKVPRPSPVSFKRVSIPEPEHSYATGSPGARAGTSPATPRLGDPGVPRRGP